MTYLFMALTDFDEKFHLNVLPLNWFEFIVLIDLLDSVEPLVDSIEIDSGNSGAYSSRKNTIVKRR